MLSLQRASGWSLLTETSRPINCNLIIFYVVFDGWTIYKLTVNINTTGCPLSKLNYISVVKHNLIRTLEEKYKLYYLLIKTQPNQDGTWKLSENFHKGALWKVVKWDKLHVIRFKVLCVFYRRLCVLGTAVEKRVLNSEDLMKLYHALT